MILYHSLQIRLSLFYFWDGLLLLFYFFGVELQFQLCKYMYYMLILCNNLNGLYIHVHVLVLGGGTFLDLDLFVKMENLEHDLVIS